jgi:hypothetical protein
MIAAVAIVLASLQPLHPWRATGVRAEVVVHSNYTVRGVGLFHRPGEELLAQKVALVPDVSCAAGDWTFAWWTPVALQDPRGTAAEIPHSQAVQHLAIVRRLDPFELGGELQLSWHEGAGARVEAWADYVEVFGPFAATLQLLQHQVLAPAEPHTWSGTHVHAELALPFYAAAVDWRARAQLQAEFNSARPADQWMSGAEVGVVGRWEMARRWWLVFGLEAWYRLDRKETTANAVLGLGFG